MLYRVFTPLMLDTLFVAYPVRRPLLVIFVSHKMLSTMHAHCAYTHTQSHTFAVRSGEHSHPKSIHSRRAAAYAWKIHCIFHTTLSLSPSVCVFLCTQRYNNTQIINRIIHHSGTKTDLPENPGGSSTLSTYDDASSMGRYHIIHVHIMRRDSSVKHARGILPNPFCLIAITNTS